MPIKQYKPTTPGRRFASVIDWSDLTRKRPEKGLTKRIVRHGGRNNTGIITARHRGGGHKRLYRIIDFKRRKDDVAAKVIAIEYDPNRSCRIALLEYSDGERRYILAPKGLKIGDEVVSGRKVEPKVGNCMPLADIPLGLLVHNVELQIGRGGQMARSAGSYVRLTAKEGKHALLVLPSGEHRRVNIMCRATIGEVGNAEHALVRLGKAGRKRWLGRRPHVRGVAMNPVSHPMGGGEGRSHGGRHPCSPTGKLAKGAKTRKKHKASDRLIVMKRKKK